MPVIRCSNEVYRLLQDKGLQDNEPISIVLDRIVFLELKKPKPKLEPKPKRKRKAKPNPEPKVELPEPAKTVVEAVQEKPKAIFRCLICDNEFVDFLTARQHLKKAHPRRRTGIVRIKPS